MRPACGTATSLEEGQSGGGCSCSVHVCGVSADGGMGVRSRQRPSEYLWTFQLGFLGRRKLRAF